MYAEAILCIMKKWNISAHLQKSSILLLKHVDYTGVYVWYIIIPFLKKKSMNCLCLGLKFYDQILSKQNKLRCNSAIRMEKKKKTTTRQSLRFGNYVCRRTFLLELALQIVHKLTIIYKKQLWYKKRHREYNKLWYCNYTGNLMSGFCHSSA